MGKERRRPGKESWGRDLRVEFGDFIGTVRNHAGKNKAKSTNTRRRSFIPDESSRAKC